MKKHFLSLLLVFSTLNAKAFDPQPRAQLQYSEEFILDQVLAIMGQEKNRDIPLPQIFYSSQTDLGDFQNEVADQWNLKPDVITSVFVEKTNHIFLLDDSQYYVSKKRCMDDSLAHELAHYVQVRYKKIPVKDFDDFMEFDAIDIQNKFREKFCSVPAQ